MRRNGGATGVASGYQGRDGGVGHTFTCRTSIHEPLTGGFTGRACIAIDRDTRCLLKEITCIPSNWRDPSQRTPELTQNILSCYKGQFT